MLGFELLRLELSQKLGPELILFFATYFASSLFITFVILGGFQSLNPLAGFRVYIGSRTKIRGVVFRSQRAKA